MGTLLLPLGSWFEQSFISPLQVCVSSVFWTWENGLVESSCSPRDCQESSPTPQNAGLEEAQAGIKIARKNINNLRYADDTIFMAESEEELRSLLMKVKEESEKSWL